MRRRQRVTYVPGLNCYLCARLDRRNAFLPAPQSFVPPSGAGALLLFPRRLCPARAAAAQLLSLIRVHSRPLAGDPSSLRLCVSVSLRSLS
jgi:hypothetical protein